ncbi:hypothetical protein AAHA92_22606 [Salvia divinorum]|uniref:DUF4283 domain-containing protein n=1 Tax=Salvia divinorum TaxID=28513 RepID=A0ABD1GPQ6_SALDI
MDLENDYYQVSFSNLEDYQKALSEGPWIEYGHNLTIWPWSANFSPKKPHPTSVVIWVRIPSIPGAFYKKHLVYGIGGMIGKVVKIDENTVAATRGRFARLAVVVDLSKVLNFRVCVNGTPYEINYESLPLVCYGCGRYGLMKADCSAEKTTCMNAEGNGAAAAASTEAVTAQTQSKEQFGSWMVVEHRQGKPYHALNGKSTENCGINQNCGKNQGESIFNFASLADKDENGKDKENVVEEREEHAGPSIFQSKTTSEPIEDKETGRRNKGKGAVGHVLKAEKAQQVKIKKNRPNQTNHGIGKGPIVGFGGIVGSWRN